MKHFFTLIALFAALTVSAQTRSTGTGVTIDGRVELDKTTHDFGDVLTGSGPLKCTFTVKNISDTPVVIYNVAKSCGCTDVEWTREEIAPGASGKISASYTNDEGPYPFSKTLTVYLSDVRKPVILRLRGTARSKKVPLSEMYPVHLGNLGLKEQEIAAGNMTQGSERSDLITMANIGRKAIIVRFTDISDGLTLRPESVEIPAGETASVSYTVSSSRQRWGRNTYSLTPVVNGVRQKPLSLWAFTKEDFSDWSKERRDRAAQPMFDESTVNLGVISGKAEIPVTFTFKNAGKSPLHIYKADADAPALRVSPIADTPAGGKGRITATLRPEDLPKGEFLIVLTLTTDTPLRPMVNLFVAGAKE